MEELDLKSLFEIFWKKKVQILLIVAIFVVLGVIYSIGFVTPEYTSSTTLVLASVDSGKESSASTTNSITTSDITLNSKLVSTYSELVKSKNVLREVISNLKIDVQEDSLRKNINVSSVKDTELIEISVTNTNSSYAAKLANEIAKVFMAKVSSIYNINNVQVVDNAEVESQPSNIHHSKDILIFAFAGFVIACGYVLITNMLDTTIKTAEDVEKEIKIPVLASIPVYDNNVYKNKRKGGRR